MKLSKLRPESKGELPLIPLRELVVFPHMVTPFFVGRPSSLKALETATSGDRKILLAFQKNNREDLSPEDIYPVGTIAQIMQVLKLPDGNIRVLVEGRFRADLKKVVRKKNITWGHYQQIPESDYSPSSLPALMQTVKDDFSTYSRLKKKFPKEILANVRKANSPDKIVGHICTALDIPSERKIFFLTEKDPQRRFEELSIALQMENELLGLKNDISGRVKKRMERSQKDFFLNEQLKEIHKELGSAEADPTGAREIEAKINQRQLPEEVRDKSLAEVKRLARLQPMSPESGVLRTYLEWVLDLPWEKRTRDRRHLREAALILDADHYDLQKAKDRILDFIAVRQLKGKIKGPILCFVGPPGTGKTSLGRSVARALGRKFARISLGGVRDEAEIRGHRKTYVGALPGKILQALKKADSANPVFLLDEIDKMSSDYRGDPSAALLEVLDPEQNPNFTDHYMEVPFDLSEVMFITTANSLHTIPYPLLDRMEVIEIPGYTEFEKKNIALQFIIPKQIDENGLAGANIRFQEEALDLIIRGYTNEAGVRNLEREISKVVRKTSRRLLKESQTRPGQWRINASALHQHQEYSALRIVPSDAPPEVKHLNLEVNPAHIRESLGSEKYTENDLIKQERFGLAIGLAWTEAGGRVLPVEVQLLTGEGKFLLTGKLGEIMKESAQIAFSFLRSHAGELGLPLDFALKKDIHIHVPEGAIPKDGPSAGITITAALLSAANRIPLIPRAAMTGEITLTDRLLGIGGVKEKVLAARRRGIEKVILPKSNFSDFEELPEEIKTSMNFVFHDTVSGALRDLFPKGTLPLEKNEKTSKKPKKKKP